MTDTTDQQAVTVAQIDVDLANKIGAAFDYNAGPEETWLEEMLACHRGDATQTREAEGEWVMIPREPTEAMRFAAAAAETRLEIWSAMLSASPTPPALSKDLRECLDQAHALIQEAKGLVGDGDVTDHLDFAEHWLGKIEVSQTLTTVLVNALREAAHDLVSTASHHGSYAAIDQDKIDCLRDAVWNFDLALNGRGGA